MEEDEDAPQVEWVASRIYQNEDAVRLIEAAIVDDPPASMADGGVIKAGFSPELDKLRGSSRGARAYIAGLESKERERTGIKSLKVGYKQGVRPTTSRSARRTPAPCPRSTSVGRPWSAASGT